MILKALEMQGFKSFPDKTVLNFEKGITAVVGPNGSGKSNISDAVRWVLGEQSTKNLRGSKMEDVIFNGTLSRKKQGYAEVTLRMDNTDRSLSVDTDEVSVTRRYYRSGESEYRINGQVSRLRDVNELFMDTGLGRDGYSLVGQGKIADMISSKSGERREMFEEAAGISHYRYRRADAQRRLSQAEENLVRLRDILTELESRVGPLKVQSEKAEKFLVLAGEKKELEIGLWLSIINKHKEKLRGQEHKITIAQSQYADAEKELEATEAEIDSIAERTRELTVKLDEIRRMSAQREEEAARVDGQIAVEENTLLHNGETIDRIKRDIESARDVSKNIDEEIEKINGEIEALTVSAEEKKKLLDEKDAEIQALRLKSGELNAESAAVSADIAAKTAKLGDKRVEFSTLKSSLDEIEARVETINNTFSSREDTIKLLTERKEQCRRELDEAREQAESLQNAAKGYELRALKRREKAEKIKKEYEDLGILVKNKQSRANMLRELEKNMEGYSGSVKTVMREVRRGTLRGIHGALSQLIKVEPKYSAAVETALGAAIQNIVTDNEAAAKRAIEFLKQSKAGRATFLPLTAIKGRILNESGLEDSLGFVDIASNLVSCDNAYREIINAQLGRTAVVEDMDCAISMAKRYSYRFRIVTLDGQVINAGGSMTGGSRVQTGGILSRGNEIEALAVECERLEKELLAKRNEYAEAHQELSQCEAELSGTKADLLRTQEEVIRKESDLKLVAGQLDVAAESMDELSAEKERALLRAEETRKQAEGIIEEVNSLNAETQALKEKVEELNVANQELSEKIENTRREKNETELELLSAQKDYQAKLMSIEQLKERKNSQGGREHELLDEIKEIESRSEETKRVIEELKLKAQNLRKDSDGSKDSVDKIIEERNSLEARSSQLRILERTKSTEREKISGELARLEEQKASMLRENDETIAKLYDEYQLTRHEAERQYEPVEDASKAQRRLGEIKSSIRALGSVNVAAIEEYKEVSERYEFMNTQITDIEKSRDELYRLIEDLTKKMAVQFMEQFNKINGYFGQTFAELFGGGKASLELDDPSNILECAININVQPPGKAIQNIDLLSGGEKGLAAISMLFAILKVTPAPFCIFDEVEAALDDVNVTRYAQYVRRMTDNTQFILITHRRGTMEEADVLYGVTMQEKGVSKLLELKTAEMASSIGLN